MIQGKEVYTAKLWLGIRIPKTAVSHQTRRNLNAMSAPFNHMTQSISSPYCALSQFIYHPHRKQTASQSPRPGSQSWQFSTERGVAVRRPSNSCWASQPHLRWAPRGHPRRGGQNPSNRPQPIMIRRSLPQHRRS